MVCAGSRAPEEASQATHAYHAIASSVERTSRGGCFCRGDARRGKGRRPKGGHVANTVACVAIISLCTKVRIGCPWDEDTCTYATKGGHLVMLQWAHENLKRLLDF